MTVPSLQSYILRLAERMENRYAESHLRYLKKFLGVVTIADFQDCGLCPCSIGLSSLLKSPTTPIKYPRFSISSHQDAVDQFWTANGPGKINLTPPAPKPPKAPVLHYRAESYRPEGIAVRPLFGTPVLISDLRHALLEGSQS